MDKFPQQLSDSISRIGDTLLDPVLLGPMYSAKKQNDTLRGGLGSAKERLEHAVLAAKHLDNGWGSAMNATAIVTGQVSPIIKDTQYDSDRIYRADLFGGKPYHSDGKEFTSQGFMVFRDDEDNVSLKLLMSQPSDDGGSEPRLYAVELDSFIKLKDILSYEHSWNLLATYTPGLLKDVDTKTSSARSLGGALLSLRGLDMSEIGHVGKSHNDPTRSRLRAALCVYATVEARLDRSLPYAVDYDAPALIAGEDGPIAVDLSFRKAPITLHDIVILDGLAETPALPPKMSLGLSVTMHPSYNAAEDRRGLLSLGDVQGISSLRDDPSSFIDKSPSLGDRLRSFKDKLHR